MRLPLQELQHINTITHEGKLLLFATDANGTIWYTVKQDGFEDNALNGETLIPGWEDWQKLALPDEEQADQSVLKKEKAELTLQDDESTYLMRSRYHTAQGQTAVAPVQLVSGLGHLYVFRQSSAQAERVAPNTLLVDRFVLDGITNKLVRKLDVRYKRSRQKHQPLQPQQNSNPQIVVDSLDFRDANGLPFFEPTTELSLVSHLEQGWFSVVLLPTNEQGKFRWHIFAYNGQSKKVELTSIRASAEGLFDLKDETILEPLPGAEEITRPRRIAGVIRRTLLLQDSQGNQLNVSGGLSATKYEVQVERETSAGPQLLRENIRVMLAVPTGDGNTAALSFAVAVDGTLAQIEEQGQHILLRDRAHDVLLPLNTLDEIKTIAAKQPARGEITGMWRSSDDWVELRSPQGDSLRIGDSIQIRGTTDYNGHFTVAKANGDSFTIETAFVGQQMGSWELVPPEEDGLVFDGIITGFSIRWDESLEVQAPNHGLVEGDAVQIEDTAALTGFFPVTRVNDDRFRINHKWQPGEAVNLKIVSRKRRGILFDGQQDWIATPPLELTQPVTVIPFGQTYSAWVWLSETSPESALTAPQTIIGQKEGAVKLALENGQATLQAKTAEGIVSAADGLALPTEAWIHLAGTVACDPETGLVSLTLCRDGAEVACQETLVTSLPLDSWSPEFIIGQGFAGKIADVRIWDKARPPTAIKDSMYLQLTGREVGLVGYYRLGAIASGQVVDFSVSGRDGVVSGGPFVSAVTLSRTLRDGRTPAIRYTNEELFAVTQRATYLETFEFKVEGIADPNDVDGNGTPIFALTYWGKRSRRSEQQTTFAGEATHLEAIGNGWFRASARFTVPDDVNLVRVFELSNVAGEWSTLEVRKHTMRLISDAITQATYDESLPLAILADAYTTLDDDLRQLAQKESEEAALLLEKRELEADIKHLQAVIENGDLENQRKIAAQEEIIRNLQQQVAEYNNKAQNPDNYWHTICDPRNPDYFLYAGDKITSNERLRPLEIRPATEQEPPQQWRFIPHPSGNGQYTIYNKSHESIIRIPYHSNGSQVYYSGEVFLEESSPRGAPGSLSFDQWRVQYEPFGTIRIYDDHFKKSLSQGVFQVVNQSFFRLALHGEIEDTDHGAVLPIGFGYKIEHTLWKRIQKELAVDIGVDRSDELEQAIEVLEKLLAFSQGDIEAILAQKQSRLQDVLDLLAALQQALAELNTKILKAFREIEQVPQVMPALHTDHRNLTTTGALLGFARPQGRLQAIETGEGNVQLSYFDAEGRMRQTNFDATSDRQNATFEQWRPDGPRACLGFDRVNSLLRLESTMTEDDGLARIVPTPVQLGEAWTVEAWFSWPLPETNERNVLLCSASAGSPIMVRKSTLSGGKLRYELGTYLAASSGFRGSEFDMMSLDSGWHHIAVVGSGADEEATTTFYVDGVQVGKVNVKGKMDVALIGNSEQGGEQFGKLAEVRAWQVALSAAEIAANSKLRLSGNEPGLAAYWPMSEAEGTLVRNHTGAAHHGTAISTAWCACSAPVGRLDRPDLSMAAVVSAEYSTIGLSPADGQRKIAILRRFFAVLAPDGVELFSDKRIEELELQWIGNAQYEPALLGYIEGAPPVPSENLTVDGELDYNGATSVALSSSEDVVFGWSREQEIGLGATLSGFFGLEEDVTAGFGLEKGILNVRTGLIGGLGFTYNFLNSSTVSASSRSATQNRLELRGAPEPGTKFPHIGRRFVPKNVGYALVTSGLADIYITRLKRSGKMIGYQVRPNQDIPIDVNTITFLINPAYTMNGSLDGQTGSAATSNRFFRHVPEMRAHYGAMYPASYYRLQEAYNLKTQIENADKLRESYFVNFNSRLIDEASLNREIDNPEFESPEIIVPPVDDNNDDEENSDKKKIDQIKDILDEDSDEVHKERDDRQQQIEEKYQDQEQRVQAAAAFEGWQHRMEDLQLRAGKRNIANTYVWDGDGGWRAETQQFANAVEHTVGASLNFNASLGLNFGIFIFGGGLELTMAATLDLTQTMTKTESRSRGIGLDVDLSGVEHVGVTDFNDNPLIPGEKVDRYRFMSFYLEGSNQNFHDFFNYVVDPEWLASNDEEARALRQTQRGKPNKAWRVLHRVTYVERPALMGFGPGARSQVDADEAPQLHPLVASILEQTAELQEHNQELEKKLNQILRLLDGSK